MARTITLKVLADADESCCRIEAIAQDAQSEPIFAGFRVAPLSEAFAKATQWKESLKQYIPIRREQFRGHAKASIRNKRPSRSFEHKSYQACDASKLELFNSFDYCLDNVDLKTWLQSTLDATLEPVRIVIQTDSLEVAALPWEQWSFWDAYYDRNNLVIALSFLDRENATLLPSPKPSSNASTRILVLLGDEISQTNSINLNFDREEFQKFKADLNSLGDRSNVYIHIARPDRSELEQLLQEVWHIIYYGGHSETLEAEKDGILYLRNQTQVRISELESSLKQSLDRGDLRLLVANACQGLGTALRLVLLGLPHVIVMRESIPDDVAHDFLRYLLESFIIGLPITSAIQHCKPHLRQAYDLRHELPGASLLPALCLTLDAVNEVDAPMIPLAGLHPICQEMRALANLARARLTLVKAEDVSALKVQEYYADLLHLKNKVMHEDDSLELRLDHLGCSAPRLVGKVIWEVDFIAKIKGQVLIWGQGFVNIRTGSSELLLDVRPWCWTGAAVVLEGQEVKQLSLDPNATIELNGERQKASFTKLALQLLEEEYGRFMANEDPRQYATQIKNFGGWLKDVNKKKFLKQLVILQSQGVPEIEAQRQSYLNSPFGRARHQLGITEFEVILPKETCVPLVEIMQQDEWTERDTDDLFREGITEDQWSTFWVPQYIVVSVAKRP